MQLKLPSVPAYSFPKTGRDRFGNEFAPGPGQYDEDKYGELSTFSRQPRATINRAGLSASQDKDRIPGPSDYDTARSYLSKKGQVIMSTAARNLNLGKSDIPGPGAYETSVSSLRKQGVAAIKTGRDNHTFDSLPGPGNYDTNKSSFTRRGVAAMKGQGHGDLYRKDAIPGPLDYDPYAYEERSKSKVGVKIPSAGRSMAFNDNTPGPSSYETNYSSLNKKGYAVAKTGRNIFAKDNTPGPGNYETSLSSLTRRGVAKLPSISNHGSSAAANPGPADYDTFQKSRTQRGLTIPKSGREGFKSESMPGPLDYDAAAAYDKATMKRGAGVAQVRAHERGKATDETPGPAYYDTAISSLSKKGQYVMPKTSREHSAMQNMPGPADYDTGKYFEKGWKKGVSIPHAGKSQNADITPGPGQYNHIPSVPDVAPYLVSNRK